MQRWIIAAGVFLALLLGGGVFGYRAYRLNKPIHPVLLQYTIPAESTPKERADKMELLKRLLREPALLTRVSKEGGLAKKLQMTTDEAAANELGKRLFVELGEADTPQGKLAVIKIGLDCKVKEFDTMVGASKLLNKAIKHP